MVLTYQQLNQRANQVARYLQKQGVTSDTLVGLCLERSPEMIVSLLAILKAGGAYVPLDPNYPANRLNELVTQTGVQYIISQKIWVDRLPAEASCILFDEEQLLNDQEDDQNLNIAVGAEQLANVLFTSGSTGRSKGVAIPHRGVVRLVKNTNFMRLDETVSMLGLAPLAFDASTLEIWGSLVNGGRLVLIPESRPTLETIKQTIQSQAVNTAFFTAALFNVLVDSDISELTTLVQLVTGGEAASAEHVLRARRQLPACELINGYGPTESSTIASFYTMSEGNWQTSSVPIGTPISNTQLYIVDSFLNPVPMGIQGELLIGGDGLAREYLHQPELTHQKFIPDPFSGRPGSRLYRTGDQARFLADGTIEFLGRLDDQVKIRGHRIEPAEIEQALCQHPTIGAAVVVVDTSTPGNKRLVAYVVPKSEAVQVDDLRGFIKASLPDYLIPSVIIPIHAMPLTINGKVDKAKLPPAFGTGEQRNSWLNLTETTMASLWAAVLSHPPVNADDHFFELGGSSLTAIQLISQIYRQFGVQLRMNDIFEHATLRELSAYVDRNPLQAISPITYRVDQPGTTTSKPRFPLSFAQKRLWIIDQIDGSQGAYNVPIVLAIRGPLNQLALQKSLNEIIRRHSILHTTFGFANGAPFQQIEPPFSLPITVSEIPGSAETDIDERINQWIRAEGYRPFDLSEGPLLRASVVQRSETSWVLILVFHHIIYDGFSIRVLADELTAIYPSILANEPVTLPQLPIQYVDYALWQVDQHRPDTLNRELTYWKTRLAGVAPLLNLPIDKPRPPVQSFAGADYSFAIPDRLWQRLRYDLREPGTTPFLRLLTVFAVWLQLVAKTSDVVIGIPVAGRTRPELNSLIGFFVNTLPLRVEVSPERTYRQQLRNVRELTLEAFDHQTLPFEQIVEELRPVRSRAYSPLVQVVFDFQEDTSNYWRLNGLEVKPVPFEQHMAKFDLHLSVRETSAGVEGTLNYRTELFEERTIAQMAHDFIQLLEQLLTQPDKPLIELQAGALPTDKALRTTASDPDFVTYNTEIEPVLPDLDYTLVETLHPIWTKLLHTDSIGLDEDFFDSGGHSLLAVQLVNEIQRQTGYSMPVASVFANPTLRKLATYLKTTEVQAVWHPLVAVKPQGDRHPLFLVHPISGDVGYVYQLAPYVAEQQPVYALRAVGLDGIAKPSVSIEEMAAHYVELITHQQAEGPYSLGGFSLGGIVAFEMARQLTQLGKKVNLVAIIDAYPINPDADTNRIPIRQLVPYYYNYWRSLPKQPSMLLPILRKKVPWASQLLLRQFRRSFYKPSVSAVNTTSQASSFVPKDLLVKTFRQAYSQYAFKPYDGKIVFLRAAKADTFGASQNKVDFGWSRYARQGVDVHEILGEHESLFSNNATIERIAHILQSYLMP
ncbi:amino acid adenylation domain-containing protein [Spirosoma sp. KNUC1025]|nr:amino acid adenylation domain-containing protein [Spirosoma sp. KNUC1025]